MKKKIDYELKFQSEEVEEIQIDYTNEGVFKKMEEIVESRGKTTD